MPSSKLSGCFSFNNVHFFHIIGVKTRRFYSRKCIAHVSNPHHFNVSNFVFQDYIPLASLSSDMWNCINQWNNRNLQHPLFELIPHIRHNPCMIMLLLHVLLVPSIGFWGREGVDMRMFLSNLDFFVSCRLVLSS